MNNPAKYEAFVLKCQIAGQTDNNVSLILVNMFAFFTQLKELLGVFYSLQCPLAHIHQFLVALPPRAIGFRKVDGFSPFIMPKSVLGHSTKYNFSRRIYVTDLRRINLSFFVNDYSSILLITASDISLCGQVITNPDSIHVVCNS